MKNKLLLIALGVSVSFNVAVLVTFGHHWIMKKEFMHGPHAGPRHAGRMQKMLGLNPEQAKQMAKAREELQKTVVPIREELRVKRNELFALLDADTVDNAKADKLVNDISILQTKIEKAVVSHSIGMRENLTPEQRVKFKAFLKKGFDKKFSRGPGFMREAMGKRR